MAVLQMVLLLCAGSSLAQDYCSPNVNIYAELEKLKDMDKRTQKIEETLAKVLRENEGKVEQWLHFLNIIVEKLQFMNYFKESATYTSV